MNAGAQAHTSYYRGANGNFNRNNSAFFNQRGAFGNHYTGNAAFNNYGNYGRGYGYGGYMGYGGYGLGYGGLGYGGYGFMPFLGGLGLGYGLGMMGGYGGYGGGGYGGYGGGGGGYANNGQSVANNTNQPALDDQTNPPTSLGTDYVTLGESDFRAGKYDAAIGAFRHALVDEPNNAGLMMMTGQALFQTGKFTQAAAATELAMGALPEDKWGAVVQNYTQLYGNIGDFTNELKTLEAAVKAKPDDPALRFLLGFQYGYLNYPKQAVDELGKAVELEGRDPAARKLHDVFATKTGAPLVGPVPQSEGPKAAEPEAKTSSVAPPRLRIAG
jgi:hypothetical protein